MLANAHRAGRALEVGVLIVPAFVRMRAAIAGNADLALRVEPLSRQVERQSGKLAYSHWPSRYCSTRFAASPSPIAEARHRLHRGKVTGRWLR
jgi:hypothetical protein